MHSPVSHGAVADHVVSTKPGRRVEGHDSLSICWELRLKSPKRGLVNVNTGKRGAEVTQKGFAVEILRLEISRKVTADRIDVAPIDGGCKVPG